MNSKEFVKLIERILSNRTAINREHPKLYVFVISPKLPLFLKVFSVHQYRELWFTPLQNRCLKYFNSK